MNQLEPQQQGTDLRLLLAQADSLCGERRFEEAAQIYQNLVQVAESRLGPNHPDTILVLQRLADSLYAMNLFRECLPIYEQLCQVGRQMLGDGDPDVINLMFKIARTQEQIGSFQDASMTYQFAIETATLHLPEGHELTMQMKGRLDVLRERIDENKRAAQAWKENTATHQVVPNAEGQQAMPPHLSPVNRAAPADHSQTAGAPGAAMPQSMPQSMPQTMPQNPSPQPIMQPLEGPPSALGAPPSAPQHFQAPQPFPQEAQPAIGAQLLEQLSQDDTSGDLGKGQFDNPFSSPQAQTGYGSNAMPPSAVPPNNGGPLGGFPPELAPGAPASPGGFPPPPGAGAPGFPPPPGGIPGGFPPPPGGAPGGFPPPPGGMNPGFPPPQGMNPGFPPPPGGAMPGQQGFPPAPNAGFPPVPGPNPGFPPVPGMNPGFPPVPGGMQPGYGQASSQGFTHPADRSSPGTTAGYTTGGFPVADGRRQNPDPYLDHLASKVADLKGHPEMEVPDIPSAYRPMAQEEEEEYDEAGWRDAFAMPNDRSTSQETRRSGDDTEYDGEYDEDGHKSTTGKQVITSRVAATKSEDLVSNVRAFKEYLIPALLIVFIGVGGFFFLKTTAVAPPRADAPSVVPVKEKGPDKPDIYTSPDNSLRLAVGTSKCSYANGLDVMTVPCVVYDGDWSVAAMQIVHSVMEKQIWFNKQPEGMVTETGIILFDNKAPDKAVLKKMNEMAQAGNSIYSLSKNYPMQAKDIATQTFMYSNPFTGTIRQVIFQSVPENLSSREAFAKTLEGNGLVLGETKFERGEIRAYGLLSQAGGGLRGIGFFVRGADRNGNFFKTNDGRVMVLGYTEGKDASNCKIMWDTKFSKQISPEKPTKIWIGKNQTLPVFVIYHCLPILLSMLAFLGIWRSMMVAPGKSVDNPVNHAFKLFGYCMLFLALASAGIQYSFCM